MSKMDLLAIYQSSQTVFSQKDLALLWSQTNKTKLKNKIAYYLKKGYLKKIRRGLYAKENHNAKEAATKIFVPSYISLETVLREEGMIFQESSSLSLVSYLSREIEVEGKKLSFHKIKNEILTNLSGIEQKEHFWQASKERAFLDTLYLFGSYHFDNLETLDWDKCFGLAKIYNKKALNARLKRQHKNYLKQNAQ